MASYQGSIKNYIKYNNGIINLINNQVVEMGKIIDFHDFWNREKMANSQTYTPEM